MNKRIMDLINEELDGEISARKRAQLYRHLEASPEAQAYFADLEKLSSLLSQVEPVEPPATLKSRIMNSVQALAKPARAKVSVGQLILSRFSSPAIPRYGFALASGICIGMLLFAVITGGIDSGARPEQVVGSMGIASAPAGVVTDFGLFQRTSTKYSVQAVTEGLKLFVEAEIQGAGAHDIALAFPANEYAMAGIRRQAGTLATMKSEKGRVSARIEGSGRFIVELDRLTTSSSPVRVELRQADKIIWEKALKTTVPD
jgi:hypothetical protein